jgi:hypothetical protein
MLALAADCTPPQRLLSIADDAVPAILILKAPDVGQASCLPVRAASSRPFRGWKPREPAGWKPAHTKVGIADAVRLTQNAKDKHRLVRIWENGAGREQKAGVGGQIIVA